LAAENFLFIAKPYRRESLADTLRTAFEREKSRQVMAAPEREKALRI
jgi:DNA-binding LytR/AlgR family response regulator